MRDYIELIKANFENLEWTVIEIIFNISDDSIGYDKLEYLDKENKLQEHWIPFKKINPLIEKIWQKHNERKKGNKRFNKLELIIYPDSSYNEKYYWDDAKERQDKVDAASVFFQWANDTMMNRIFEYEREHKLLIPNYNVDGVLIDYESSWNTGVFTFTIIDNLVKHSIQLTKDGVERVLPMPLPEYFVKGLLEHHQITNEELQEEWQPWDTLVIRSPHNSIPYDEWQDYVTYSLEKDIK